MSRNSCLQPVFASFAAHPYVWTLAGCLCCAPFLFGTDNNVTSYALSLETIAVIAVTALFVRNVRLSQEMERFEPVILVVLVALVACFLAMQYSRAQYENLWVFGVSWTLITVFLLLFDMVCFRKQCLAFNEERRRLNCLVIIAAGFFLKLFYVIVTSIYARQHDVGIFEGPDGHAVYIEYLLRNRALPDFDLRTVWQFYHPPLHHTISAAWIWFNENVMQVDTAAARESLQTLTLFYSTCIVITAYRILRHFRLNGSALYIPLIIVSFHPTFVLFSGSINNDVLSVAFILAAVLCALRWYETRQMREIIKLAWCIGLGMMTKLSVAIVTPSIAFVFLTALYKEVRAKRDWKKLLVQFTSFCAVCIPVGTWFGIRNYLKWGIPFSYVQEMPSTDIQYLGRMSFTSRVTDFSAYQFASPYLQLQLYPAGSTTEYNPLVALLKSSMFGEYRLLDASSGLLGEYGHAVALALFWVNVVIASFALIAMIIVCLRKGASQRAATLFLASLYAVMMIGFYKMAADYPFTCSMDFRYISPTVIVGAVFIGLFLQRSARTNTVRAKILSTCVSVALAMFAILSEVTYIAVQWK